jgi:hypothetical protein
MPCYGSGLTRQANIRPYVRRRDDPVTRPLKVFALDSGTARLDGALATIDVPWEPLTPGPVGALLAIDPSDGSIVNSAADLDDPLQLIRGGFDPAVSEHRFHQQMVYAVCARIYGQFQGALGRLVAWGFDGPGQRGRLVLRPHAPEMGANAAYEKDLGRISFGYFPGPALGSGRSAPGGRVFTCLSHDIIAHELTHALLDGLRSHFDVPTSPDVLAFHEGFADLVTVLQHFTHREVVETQIRRTGGQLSRADLMTSIAAQFGLTTRGRALRCAVSAEVVRYRPDMEPHEMGSVLLSAMFAAFADVYARKAERFTRLASWRPPDPMPSELAAELAREASKLARQFLNLAIRAVDYCPPVDLHLGEYLRALITADRELVPDDPWNYRDSLIAAFAERAIYPHGVDQLSEDTLRWRPPARFLEPIAALHFSQLRFAGDPSLPAGEPELIRQAQALWDFATRRHVLEEFGLSPEGVDQAEPCVVESIRTARRVGPDGQVLFDLVAELTQRRRVTDANAQAKFFGGCTVIVGPEGDIRYIVSKNVRNNDRLGRQLAYQRDSGYWSAEDSRYQMKDYAHVLAHRRADAAAS